MFSLQKKKKLVVFKLLKSYHTEEEIDLVSIALKDRSGVSQPNHFCCAENRRKEH